LGDFNSVNCALFFRQLIKLDKDQIILLGDSFIERYRFSNKYVDLRCETDFLNGLIILFEKEIKLRDGKLSGYSYLQF
jgi:hypothetical protein